MAKVLLRAGVAGSAASSSPAPAQARAAAGAAHASTTIFASGVVTRGVLLDFATDGPLPGSHHAATGGDLDAAEGREGVTVEPGDALIIRGGRTVTDDPPVPGISTDALWWMQRRGVSLYAGDIGNARPALHPGAPSPCTRSPW